MKKILLLKGGCGDKLLNITFLEIYAPVEKVRGAAAEGLAKLLEADSDLCGPALTQGARQLARKKKTFYCKF